MAVCKLHSEYESVSDLRLPGDDIRGLINALVIRVPNVIDTDPNYKQRIGRGPRRI